MSIALARPPKEYDERDQGEVRNSIERILRFLFESTNTLRSRGMTAKIAAAVTNATADLTIDVIASTVDYPISVKVYEGAPSGVPLVDTAVAANATLTKVDFAALGGRALPLREVQRWWVLLENSAGVQQWTGPTAADRDALPNGTVTRLGSSLKCEYDGDTDTISITLANGATKVFSGLIGPGTATYTVGDAVTTGSVEAALAADEERSTYTVTYTGGGISEVFYRGSLYGANKDYTQGALEVLVTPSATKYTFSYGAVTGHTIQMRTDGGAYGAAAASPFDVTRNAAGGADKVVQLRALRNSDSFEGAPRTITVPAQAPLVDTTAIVDALYLTSIDAATDTVTVGWTYSGSLGGGDFQLVRVRTGATSADHSGTKSVVATVTGASPRSVGDVVPDNLVVGFATPVTYSYFVRVRDSAGVVIAISAWLDVTTNYT